MATQRRGARAVRLLRSRRRTVLLFMLLMMVLIQQLYLKQESPNS